MIDIKELRRLAQAATPGGWYVKRGNYIYGCKEVTDGEEKWHPVIACTDDDEVNVNFEANAAFIAAANPAAIAELLDRLEAEESKQAALLDCLNEWKELAKSAEKERDALRARIEQMERQEPVGCVESLFDDVVIIHNNFDRAAPVYLAPGAQPAPNAVAYLDLGVGGYMDIGTDLTDEELDAIPKGRHMLGIVGTYGIEGYVPAQPAPRVPDGWKTDLLIVEHAMRMNNWDWNSNTSDDLKRSAYKIISKLLA